MKLTDLNRQGGIGANCTLLQIGDINLIIDCGLHPKIAGRMATPDLAKVRSIEIDLIIVTHCHLDHIGSLPLLMRDHPNTPVMMSTASQMLVERMLHNSANVMKRQKEEDNIAEYPLFTHEEIDRVAPRLTGIPVGHSKKFRPRKDEIEITFHHAGHVAGAVGVEIRHKHRHIFLTGDVLFEDQRTLKGAQFPAGHFDTVVLETTRGNTERAPGQERVHEVARLIDCINDTIQRGGSFLVPAFALGRMQEILSILHDARKFGRLVDCPVFASGLGLDLADYFDEITRKTKTLNFHRSILKDLKLKPAPRKLAPGEDPQQNGIYVLGSGMLVENTPSYTLASGLVGHARNTVAFVGYCDPDTPGGQLLKSAPGDSFLFKTAHVKAKIKARIEKFELSGHADREELLQFAVQTNARSLVLTHGDPEARDWFKQQLAEKMPKTKVFDPVPGKEYLV